MTCPSQLLLNMHFIGGRVTYSGPTHGLLDYATEIYHKTNLGTPPVANAPEVIILSNI